MNRFVVLPQVVTNFAFGFLLIAYFLIFFNDFLGFEGALGVVLLYTLFLKFKYFRGKSAGLTSQEWWLIGTIGFYIFMMALSTIVNYTDFIHVEKFVAKYNKVLYFLAFVYLLVFINFNFQKFEIFIKIMAYATILMLLIEVAIYGLGTHLGGEFSNRGTGAWYFSSVMIATVVLAVDKLKKGIKSEFNHYILLSAVLAMIIVFTSTRSIWLSMLFSLLLIGLFGFKSYQLHRLLNLKHYLLALVCVFVISTLTFDKWSQRVNDAVNDVEFMQKGEFYTSLGLRVVMYKTALDGIEQNPILGIGEVNYKKTLQDIYLSKMNTDEEALFERISKFKQIHNQFLMDAWMKGVLGFISLILLFAVPFIIFYKALAHKDSVAIGLIGIGFLMNSFVFFQFGAVLTYSHGLVFFVLWLVLLTSVVASHKREI